MTLTNTNNLLMIFFSACNTEIKLNTRYKNKDYTIKPYFLILYIFLIFFC